MELWGEGIVVGGGVVRQGAAKSGKGGGDFSRRGGITDALPLGQPSLWEDRTQRMAEEGEGGGPTFKVGELHARKNIKKITNGGQGITLNVGVLQHVVTTTLPDGRSTNMAAVDYNSTE